MKCKLAAYQSIIVLFEIGYGNMHGNQYIEVAKKTGTFLKKEMASWLIDIN